MARSWAPDWARAVIGSLLLAACVQGDGIPSSGSSSVGVTVPSLEAGRTNPAPGPDVLAISRAMKDLVVQAKGACQTEQEGESLPLPSSAPEPIPSCFRERILAAFWLEADASVCLAHESDDGFLSCVVTGSYLTMVLRNVAKSHGRTPPALGPREWLDQSVGRQAASDYINALDGYLCRYGGYAMRAKCRYERRLEIFAISEEESVLCEDLEEPEECQMTTSFILFIQRATPLAS